MIEDKWVEVKGFPSYEISEKGVRRKGKEKTLKGRNWLGYPKLTLMLDGKKHEKRIHKLIGEHFIPNPNNLPIVNHLDSDRSNHAIKNLEWTDNSGNQLHRWKTQKEGMFKKKYEKEYDLSNTTLNSLDKAAAMIRLNGKSLASNSKMGKGKAKALAKMLTPKKMREAEYKAAGMNPARRAINHMLPFNQVIR